MTSILSQIKQPWLVPCLAVVDLPTGAVTKQINVGAGTLTVGTDLTLNGGTAVSRDALLTVSTGLVTINAKNDERVGRLGCRPAGADFCEQTHKENVV